MKKYERPEAVVIDGVSEGVYAASGSAPTCWKPGIKTTQKWNGEGHVYEISLIHTTAVTHFSESCTVRVSFGGAVITSARAEGSGNYEVDGIGTDTLTIRRIHHANGEHSGDSVTYKLFAFATNQDLTQELPDEPGIEVIDCEKTGTPNFPDID